MTREQLVECLEQRGWVAINVTPTGFKWLFTHSEFVTMRSAIVGNLSEDENLVKFDQMLARAREVTAKRNAAAAATSGMQQRYPR